MSKTRIKDIHLTVSGQELEFYGTLNMDELKGIVDQLVCEISGLSNFNKLDYFKVSYIGF